MIITFEDKEAGLKAVNLDLCFAYNLYEDEKEIVFVNMSTDNDNNLIGLAYNNDDLRFLRKLFKKIIKEQANGGKLFDITKHYTKYLQLEKGGKNNEKL